MYFFEKQISPVSYDELYKALVAAKKVESSSNGSMILEFNGILKEVKWNQNAPATPTEVEWIELKWNWN